MALCGAASNDDCCSSGVSTADTEELAISHLSDAVPNADHAADDLDEMIYDSTAFAELRTSNAHRLSRGSAVHNSGACKPCAFLFKEEGCRAGLGCAFCHLCGPNEKLRRKKLQKSAWRQSRIGVTL